jgi:serine/threonine protein kinase
MGVLLFRMLSGTRPFENKEPKDLIEKHLHHPPPSLDQTVDNIPPRVVRLVASMLAKEPDHRPDTAAAVAQMLRQA